MNKNIRLYVLSALFVCAVFIWYVALDADITGKLKVAVLGIGQGDAIFIKAPGGNEVLIDGGPGRIVLSALGKEMPFYDRSIDLLMITNPDKDHIAGFVDVMKTLKVGAMLLPGTINDSEIYKEVLATAQKTGVKIILGRRGEKIFLGGGAYIEVLFPDRDVSGLDTNTGSLIAKLIYGKTSMLLTGDAPSGVEEYLAKIDGASLRSDILKVAHHGSKTSVSEMFYGIVHPQVAAISVGAGNSYGHPNKETLDMLNQFGIKVLRTDQVGTIRFMSDGEKFTEE